jgi:plastocyanin
MHAVVRATLALVVGIALAACGSSATPTTNAPAASAAAAACVKVDTAGTVMVDITDFKFNTEPVQAKVGDTITWTNKGAVPHSAALDDGSCPTDTIQPGTSGNLKFTVAGTYPYHCAIHPTQMKGTIVVSG